MRNQRLFRDHFRHGAGSERDSGRASPIRTAAPMAPLVLAAALAAMPAAPAAATVLADPTLGTCTTLHCSSLSVLVRLAKHGTDPLPWTAEIYKPANACLRLTLSGLSSSLSYRLLMLADDGSIWTRSGNAGFDIGSLAARGPGYNAVVIYAFAADGVSAVETTLTLKYGIYPAGNPNCSIAS